MHYFFAEGDWRIQSWQPMVGTIKLQPDGCLQRKGKALKRHVPEPPGSDLDCTKELLQIGHAALFGRFVSSLACGVNLDGVRKESVV
jgi:hypothetical protein